MSKKKPCVLKGTAGAIAAIPYREPQQADNHCLEGSWDLHTHSTFSDGEYTVDELIEQARACGLARLAITDHDSVSQLSFIRDRARALDFPVLAGCEVSAINPKTGKKVHILAYGLEATPDGSGPLERIVAQTQYLRTANSLWQAWRLKQANVEFSGKQLSIDEVCEVAAQSTSVYKTHIMQALTGRPKNDPDYQFCWDVFFKKDGIAARSIEYPKVKKVVRAIREQGGVPVLAHPGQKDSWSAIPDLIACGLMGIEAYHPSHTPEDVDRAFEAAERFGLFVTGGSDFHGRYSSAPCLGTAYLAPQEATERLNALFEIEQTLQ